jgi:hypothetical protein
MAYNSLVIFIGFDPPFSVPIAGGEAYYADDK